MATAFTFQSTPYQAALDFDAPAASTGPVEEITLRLKSYGFPDEITVPLLPGPLEGADDYQARKHVTIGYLDSYDGDVHVVAHYRVAYIQHGSHTDPGNEFVAAWKAVKTVFTARGATNAGEALVAQSTKSAEAARKNLARQLKAKNKFRRVTASKLNPGDKFVADDNTEQEILSVDWAYVEDPGYRRSREYTVITTTGEVLKSNSVTRWTVVI